jgi:DNA mismatch endonuclease (patch repair protein)
MRDADTDRELRDEGWSVIRIFEHEEPTVAADVVFSRVMDIRTSRRSPDC